MEDAPWPALFYTIQPIPKTGHFIFNVFRVKLVKIRRKLKYDDFVDRTIVAYNLFYTCTQLLNEIQ